MSGDLDRAVDGPVDLHHHAILPGYRRRLSAIGVRAQPGIDFPGWSAEASLAMMDRLGIGTAVLSVASPGFYFGDQGFATSLCRDTNDELAAVVAGSGGRFRAFMAVPLPSAADAVAEVRRLAGRPGFAGVSLLSNYGGHYLGDPRFDPLLAELDGLGALVHVHPTLPPWWAEGAIDLRPSLLEYVFDTSRTLTSLVLAGVADRHPGIRWVFSHCGGVVPFVAHRLAIAEPLPELARVGERGIEGTLREFRYDCALSASASGLGALLSVVDETRVVFGSDFPFVDEATVRAEIELLAGLGPRTGLAALGGNGRALLEGKQ
ncbi:amidohydrolase family protein [Nonomuraea antimicrobica]|uniref:Amidohydrolase family protein n=1 Tax=Nonomuraea antimicrobica TaxID=561173 RepID=A0ABP7B391_9ACTN